MPVFPVTVGISGRVRDFKVLTAPPATSSRKRHLIAKADSVTQTQLHLCENLKRLGYYKASHVTLYGQKVSVLSDPFVDEELVFVEGQEEKSNHVRRIPLPLNVLNMARRGPGQAV
jgi:hypothetical protein